MDSEIQREVDALCLGAKIRKLRQRRGMTLQEVSILSGLSKSLLSQIENDASAPPLSNSDPDRASMPISRHQLFISLTSPGSSPVIMSIQNQEATL